MVWEVDVEELREAELGVGESKLEFRGGTGVVAGESDFPFPSILPLPSFLPDMLGTFYVPVIGRFLMVPLEPTPGGDLMPLSGSTTG